VNDEIQEKWTGRVIVCIDLNAFYSSCEELRDQSLKGKSHAVIMTDQEKGKITKGVISTCSYEARNYGIKSAMTLSEALSLNPNLILVPVDINYYSQISKKVMGILEDFSNIIEKASIDEAFLDCTEKRGQVLPEEYAMNIKSAIKDRSGLSCSVGVTSTKASAKIAADYRKPNGLTVVYPYNLKKFLEPLDVGSVAGIGPKTQQKLREMGIETLGQLALTDVERLIQQFGVNGEWMWQVANGIDKEQVTPRGNHISISSETTLSSHTRDKNKIKAVLENLVDEIYERARSQNYLFRTVGIKLVRADFTIETRETTFQVFSETKLSIASEINPLLNRFTYSTEQPSVRKVGLKLSNLIRSYDFQKIRTIQKTIPDYF
jgi:Nucleotidyltransferase/DNA polymerase involved in DNA repair